MKLMKFLPGLLLLFSQVTFAEECTFLPEKPRPDWVSGNPNMAEHYVGVGIANRTAGEPQAQIEKARQAAFKDLSKTITVSIQQDMVINEQLSQEQASQDVKSITRIFSNTSLRDVKTDETWLDRENCIVWVRVKVHEDIVSEFRKQDAQQAKLKTLLEHLSAARNDDLPVNDRVENINLAKILLEEINFSVLDDPKGEEYYRNLVETVNNTVTSKQKKQETAESLFNEAKAQLERANTTSSKTEKSALTRKASKTLNQVLSKFSYNSKTDWSEKAALRLGEIARNAGNDCAAKHYFEQLNNHTKYDEWKTKASGLLIGLSCDKGKQKEFKWRQHFDGIKVLLTCAYKTKTEIVYWEDLCDRIRNKISSYGAIVEEEDFSDRDLKKIIRRKHRSKILARMNKYEKKMLFVASGSMNSRKSKKNPGGEDYQFKGKFTTQMLSGKKLEFSDKFSGAGGWNPVSEDMAMEILGVHIEKRWVKKFEKSL